MQWGSEGRQKWPAARFCWVGALAAAVVLLGFVAAYWTPTKPATSTLSFPTVVPTVGCTVGLQSLTQGHTPSPARCVRGIQVISLRSLTAWIPYFGVLCAISGSDTQ